MKAAQLKALLSKVPDDAEVVIHDADTDQPMAEFELRKLQDGRYTMAGGYVDVDLDSARDFLDLLPHEVIT